MNGEASYERRYDAKWASDVLEKCLVTFTDEAVTIQVDCPQCRHQLDDFIAVDLDFAQRLARGIATRVDVVHEPAIDVPIVLSCNCESKHDGRPEGARGCGRYARIVLRTEIGERIRRFPRPGYQRPFPAHVQIRAEPATAQERAWDELAGEAEGTMLSRLTDLGVKWSATVGTVLGLFGIAALVEGADQVRKIGGPYDWMLGVLGGITAVSGLAATIWAARIAQGRPREVSFITGTLLRRTTRREAGAAVRMLRWSRRAIVVASLCGIAALGLLIYSPEAA